MSTGEVWRLQSRCCPLWAGEQWIVIGLGVGLMWRMRTATVGSGAVLQRAEAAPSFWYRGETVGWVVWEGLSACSASLR